MFLVALAVLKLAAAQDETNCKFLLEGVALPNDSTNGGVRQFQVYSQKGHFAANSPYRSSLLEPRLFKEVVFRLWFGCVSEAQHRKISNDIIRDSGRGTWISLSQELSNNNEKSKQEESSHQHTLLNQKSSTWMN